MPQPHAFVTSDAGSLFAHRPEPTEPPTPHEPPEPEPPSQPDPVPDPMREPPEPETPPIGDPPPQPNQTPHVYVRSRRAVRRTPARPAFNVLVTRLPTFLPAIYGPAL
jgi:hypothetical protein